LAVKKLKKKASEASLEQTKLITQKLAQIKNYHLVQHALNIAKKVFFILMKKFILTIIGER